MTSEYYHIFLTKEGTGRIMIVLLSPEVLVFPKPNIKIKFYKISGKFINKILYKFFNNNTSSIPRVHPEYSSSIPRVHPEYSGSTRFRLRKNVPGKIFGKKTRDPGNSRPLGISNQNESFVYCMMLTNNTIHEWCLLDLQQKKRRSQTTKFAKCRREQ